MSRSFGDVGTDVFELLRRGDNQRQLIKEVRNKTRLFEMPEVKKMVLNRDVAGSLFARVRKALPKEIQAYIITTLAAATFRPIVVVWVSLLPGALPFHFYRHLTATLAHRAAKAAFGDSPLADSFVHTYSSKWDSVQDAEPDMLRLEEKITTDAQEACLNVFRMAMNDNARSAFLQTLNYTIDSAELLETKPAIVIEYVAREIQSICADSVKQLQNSKTLLAAILRS
jgi:hypothetical protein